MQFIDFEYGSYNYRGFDFGNHWNEYAGFEGDYSRYPDAKQQATFVKAYLQQQGNKSPVSRRRAVSGLDASCTVISQCSFCFFVAAVNRQCVCTHGHVLRGYFTWSYVSKRPF